jgi:hypothetical protein
MWADVLRRVAIFVLCILLYAILLIVLAPSPSPAADTGEFANEPGAREWFQKSQQQECCSLADGHRGLVRRAPGGGYEAFIKDEWVPVPPGAVKEELSPFSTPVIWYVGKNIRCLMLNRGV